MANRPEASHYRRLLRSALRSRAEASDRTVSLVVSYLWLPPNGLCCEPWEPGHECRTGPGILAADLRHRSRDDLRSEPLRRVPCGPLAGRATRRKGGIQALGVGKPGIRVLGQAAEDHSL